MAVMRSVRRSFAEVPFWGSVIRTSFPQSLSNAGSPKCDGGRFLSVGRSGLLRRHVEADVFDVASLVEKRGVLGEAFDCVF